MTYANAARENIAKLLGFVLESEGEHNARLFDPKTHLVWSIATIDGIAALWGEYAKAYTNSFYAGCGAKKGPWYVGCDELNIKANATTLLDAWTILLARVLAQSQEKAR